MISQTEICRRGGKAAILDYVREKLPDMPIPRYFVLEAGQGLDVILPEFETMIKPVIVRSSSPYEYGDFEGVFESVAEVHERYGLERAVRIVEESATSERAREYAKQNRFKCDGRIHKIIQEQSPSRFCGAMMRHPNNPDLIFINYFSGRGRYSREHDSFLWSESAQGEAGYCRGFSSSKKEEHINFLVEQYKIIEALKEIAPKHSLFVEFGLEPFALYQVRPFKKKETAEFQLPQTSQSKEDSFQSDFCFGITTQEGIVLPVARSFGCSDAFSLTSELGLHRQRRVIDFKFSDYERELEHNLDNISCLASLGGVDQPSVLEEHVPKILRCWHSRIEDMTKKKPYCLAISSAQRDSYDTDLSVPHVRTLLIGGTNTFLVHNLIRLLKKSQVSLGYGPPLWATPFFKNLRTLEDKVRIISNGKEAVAIRE